MISCAGVQSHFVKPDSNWFNIFISQWTLFIAFWHCKTSGNNINDGSDLFSCISVAAWKTGICNGCTSPFPAVTSNWPYKCVVLRITIIQFHKSGTRGDWPYFTFGPDAELVTLVHLMSSTFKLLIVQICTADFTVKHPPLRIWSFLAATFALKLCSPPHIFFYILSFIWLSLHHVKLSIVHYIRERYILISY